MGVRLPPSAPYGRSEMTQNELDCEAVVEEYRKLIGATKVHVDYVPGVDPKVLRENLLGVQSQFDELHSYPIELQLRAEIAQLEGRLSRLGKLAQVDFRTAFDEPEGVRELRHKIFTETDIISTNLSESLAFCRAHSK